MLFWLKKLLIKRTPQSSFSTKKKRAWRASGFTLMELLVAVTISAIVAAFTIPNFKKSMITSEQKVLAQQMVVLQEALGLYHLREGDYPETIAGSGSGVMAAVNEINDTLNVNLMIDIHGVNCVDGGSNNYVCDFEKIEGTDYDYTLTLDTSSDVITCSSNGENSCYYCNQGTGSDECPCSG